MLFSAPGRTEIIGNHTDHQRGCVLAAAVNLETVADALRNNNFEKFLSIVAASGRSSWMYLQNINPAGAREHQDVAFALALKCLGSAPACYLILAMLADVIDHIEFKNNIRTDGLTMSIYSSIMVAGTPICNAIFSAVLGLAGYDQAAVVGETVQSAAAQSTITGCYIWTETIAFAICAALMILWTVEKKLPEEQGAIRQLKSEG